MIYYQDSTIIKDMVDRLGVVNEWTINHTDKNRTEIWIQVKCGWHWDEAAYCFRAGMSYLLNTDPMPDFLNIGHTKGDHEITTLNHVRIGPTADKGELIFVRVVFELEY